MKVISKQPLQIRDEKREAYEQVKQLETIICAIGANKNI